MPLMMLLMHYTVMARLLLKTHHIHIHLVHPHLIHVHIHLVHSHLVHSTGCVHVVLRISSHHVIIVVALHSLILHLVHHKLLLLHLRVHSSRSSGWITLHSLIWHLVHHKLLRLHLTVPSSGCLRIHGYHRPSLLLLLRSRNRCKHRADRIATTCRNDAWYVGHIICSVGIHSG